MTAPDLVTSNAWRGEPATGPLAPTAGKWAVGGVQAGVVPAAPPAHDPWDWRSPQVGWGLVLPDLDRFSVDDLVAARDAPEPLQALVAARGPAPVLRWRPDKPAVLLRYYSGFANPETIPIGGTPRGVDKGAIPSFLLLWGGLDRLPWHLQYALNLDPRIFAGRLPPLPDDALERYVGALLGEWDRPAPAHAQALVWATDHGPTDITRLMRLVVAEPVRARYAADADITVEAHESGDATGARLAATLAARSPGVVVTASHGFTGPVGAPDPERLGWLVDADLAPTDPAALLAGWQPGGAVWYAHACCGAGSDAPSTFTGLFAKDSALDRMLTEVAGLGSLVAPLPTALLGAGRPLRAFVGHVEPTYDWTIRDPDSQHALTADLVTALYDELMLGRPVGWALKAVHVRSGAEAAALDDARKDVLESRPAGRRAGSTTAVPGPPRSRRTGRSGRRAAVDGRCPTPGPRARPLMRRRPGHQADQPWLTTSIAWSPTSSQP